MGGSTTSTTTTNLLPGLLHKCLQEATSKPRGLPLKTRILGLLAQNQKRIRGIMITITAISGRVTGVSTTSIGKVATTGEDTTKAMEATSNGRVATSRGGDSKVGATTASKETTGGITEATSRRVLQGPMERPLRKEPPVNRGPSQAGWPSIFSIGVD